MIETRKVYFIKEGLIAFSMRDNERHKVAIHSFCGYNSRTHQLTEYKEDPMLYCKTLIVLHTFGDRRCSSVIESVRR